MHACMHACMHDFACIKPCACKHACMHACMNMNASPFHLCLFFFFSGLHPPVPLPSAPCCCTKPQEYDCIKAFDVVACKWTNYISSSKGRSSASLCLSTGKGRQPKYPCGKKSSSRRFPTLLAWWHFSLAFSNASSKSVVACLC